MQSVSIISTTFLSRCCWLSLAYVQKLICCLFDHFFIRHTDGKYRSATALLVDKIFLNLLSDMNSSSFLLHSCLTFVSFNIIGFPIVLSATAANQVGPMLQKSLLLNQKKSNIIRRKRNFNQPLYQTR